MNRRESLSSILARSMIEKIDNGTYSAGTQIPTEAELCAEYNVSRTVVREAVASLKTKGLLLSRQGSGVFVSERPPEAPFRFGFEVAERAQSIVQVLELRIGVEVEGAGLAAERRTDEDVSRIFAALAVDDHDDEDVRGARDFEFHTSIATATKNPFFIDFMKSVGPRLIPRTQLMYEYMDQIRKVEYLKFIRHEHERIAEMIKDYDVLNAREAMRFHLMGSIGRYRRLMNK